ncbi:hypothetical protein [Streptomyces purpureus]|uniref:Uncharacterized protein n=1 Tax=Streptomyces purpureus TaxID=1951 RepID=A0A918GZ99_9ACTN|nr:hypothetical protein [Streptomyces purpureus]GGT27007.1 hypothetical protein GCM10014713_20420 [Streptomyces purpureus]
MDAHEAAELHDAMRRYGIPGVIEPEDPGNASGPWRVVDRDQGSAPRDITTATLAAVAAARERRPTRGFVIAG